MEASLEMMKKSKNERRKAERIHVVRDYCYYPGEKRKKFPCTAMNISVTGVCIESGKKLTQDDIVFIHIECGKDVAFKSVVVWEMSGTYGLRFMLETNEDFDNISYVMNNCAGKINR